VGLDQDQPARAALGRAPLLNARAERALSSAAVIALFVTGYFAIGRSIRPGSAHDLTTTWDRRIPFAAWTVWIYLWLFPASLLPLFVVRCPRLFRRTIAAYAIVIVASLAVFAAFPVTSERLRASAGTLDAGRLSPWAVGALYRLDPPVNLFPSLHLSIAAIAALSAWTASRGYGATLGTGVVLVAISILTVKQHVLADAVGALLLAGTVYAAVLRPYAPAPGVDPAYGWRGPAAYAALALCVYAGFVAAYLLHG
jgi:PAP2 superfamily protein